MHKRCLHGIQDKIIVEFIQMTLFKSLHALILNTVCRYLDDSWRFCFVIVVHESLVGPEQLNSLLFFRKDVLIYLFKLKTTEGLIHNHYKSFKCFIITFTDWKTGFSRKGVNTFEQDEDFSFVEKSFFFFISYCSSEATEDTNIFPRRQNKCNFYTDLQYLEVFTPLLPLYAMCFLLDHQWTFETCVIVV